MLICSVCGKLNNAGSRNCDLCGAPLAGQENGAMQVQAPEVKPPVQEQLTGPPCPVCRRSNRSNSVFCAFCGYRLQGPNAAQPYVLPNVPRAAQQVGHGNTPANSGEAGNIASGTLLKRRYRILRKIAQGGMGAVYESTDTVSSGVKWAVKEISPAALPVAERMQAVADFRREAQMLAALQHPNLPKVVETFEEFGKYFLVMEFIPGHTLQNILDSTPGFLPEERIRVWLRQIFDVLGYLHAQTPPIVYRDLKPANIMLLESTERIKLIDFGIARFHKMGKTRDTEAFGTAGYAPPEQYGKGQTDQRSDVYALAATMHYLATKHDPGLNPFNWLPARQYNSGISAKLETALQIALNLDPQKRFQSITDFAQALGLASPDMSRKFAGVSKAQSPPVTAPAPTLSAAPDPKVQSAKSKSPSSNGSGGRKRAAQNQPVIASPVLPVNPIAASAPSMVAAVSAIPAVAALPAVVAIAVQPKASPAAPTQIQDSVDAPTSPELVLSDYIVDLGEAKWNNHPERKIAIVNAGGGEIEGTVRANQPWLALNMSSFRGNTQTLDVRVKKSKLAFERVELQVPNLFAIIWARTRWAVPFIGLWFWVFILAASSLGRMLFWGIGFLVASLLAVEALLWWSAFHVRLLVPAPKLNKGRLIVKSSGGEKQIEVRVKAAPSLARKAAGWITAAALMAAELGALVWAALGLAGKIGLPGI